MIGKSNISNNFLVCLKLNRSAWGPDPFKVNYFWFERRDFLIFLEKEWPKIKLEGRSDFVLKEKLKLLKGSLRKWKNEDFGWIDLELDKDVEELNVVHEFLSNFNEDQIFNL